MPARPALSASASFVLVRLGHVGLGHSFQNGQRWLIACDPGPTSSHLCSLRRMQPSSVLRPFVRAAQQPIVFHRLIASSIVPSPLKQSILSMHLSYRISFCLLYPFQPYGRP
jgi:hypothetical protein